LLSLNSANRAEDSIREKVQEEVRQGATLDEIQAGIAEDVEDRYHELLSNREPQKLDVTAAPIASVAPSPPSVLVG
jgi:hypothetical protein